MSLRSNHSPGLRWLLRFAAFVLLSISGGAAAAQLFHHHERASQVGHDSQQHSVAPVLAIASAVKVGPELLPLAAVAFLALPVQRRISRIAREQHKQIFSNSRIQNLLARAPPLLIEFA